MIFFIAQNFIKLHLLVFEPHSKRALSYLQNCLRMI